MKSVTNRVFSIFVALVVLAACVPTDPNIETAKLNAKNGELEKAIESVNKAIETNPANPEAYEYKGNYLGDLAQKKNNPADRQALYADMKEAYKKASELYAGNPSAEARSLLMENNLIRFWANEFNAGVKLVQVDNPGEQALSKAESHLNNAVTIEPDSIISRTTLAEIYYMNNKTEEAISTLSKAIEMKEDTPVNLYLRLAAFYESAANTKGVISTLKTAQSKFPENIDIVQSLANAYLSSNDTENALKTVKTLIEREPENAQYRLVYGTQLYTTTENYTTEVEANYERIGILKKDLNSTKNKKQKVMIQNELDSLNAVNDGINKKVDELTEEALVQLKKVIELKPEDANAQYTTGIIIQNKAAVLFKERDATLDNKKAAKLDEQAKDVLREALVYYEKAIEIKPDDKDYWMTLFKVYTTLGMTDKAQVAMEKAGL